MLTKNLSSQFSEEIISLWEEFEHNKNGEAQLAQAIDKMEGTLHTILLI